MHAVALEFYKVRRRKVWLILLALLGMQFLWGLVDYFRMKPSAQLLANGWLSCLQQFSLLNVIIMPFFSAILASRLCDIEHKGQTLKLLETVQPASHLFAAKFLCGTVYLAAASVLQAGMMLALGAARGFNGNPPLNLFALHLLFTFVVSLAIYLLQQILSLLIQNQMIPLAVGLAGSFTGLFSLFFPKTVMQLVLWSYYGVLSSVQIDYNSQMRIAHYTVLNPDWGAFAVLLMVLIVLYVVGCSLFARKEV